MPPRPNARSTRDSRGWRATRGRACSGEDALWYYKRGAARAALGRAAEADADLRKALQSEGRKWVYGRSHLELGKLAMKSGKKSTAREELATAISLCENDNDGLVANEARQLMNTLR